MMMIIRRSEISFVEVGHVEFLYHGVRGEVDHVDPDALPTAVGSQPLQVGTVGSLSQLGEQVGQHCEGSRPEVDLEAVQVTWTDEGISHDALLVLDVPGEQDEHVLDVSCWQIPHPVVAFDLVGVWEEDIHSRDDEGLAPQLPDRGDLRGEDGNDAGAFHLSQDQGVRIILAELELKGQEQEFSGVFPEELSDVDYHGVLFSDDKGAVVDKKRSLVIDSEVQVADAGHELMLDIPALALVEDADLGTGEGARVVRARDGQVGDQHVISQLSHPVECEMVGVSHLLLTIVIVFQLSRVDLQQVLEVLFRLVQQVPEVNHQGNDQVFQLHLLIIIRQIKVNQDKSRQNKADNHLALPAANSSTVSLILETISNCSSIFLLSSWKGCSQMVRLSVPVPQQK